MSEISYDDPSFPVRADLVAAQGRAWHRVAAPGTWWTGEERIEIAAETRHATACGLCCARKAALSPNSVQGEHESLGQLPAPVIDLIHRVRTDPGRLSRRWFDELAVAGLADTHYVEALAVVVTVTSIDFFCRALGVPVHPLPTPLPGKPTCHRPPEALPEEAWVPMIAHANAQGPEADLYGHNRYPNVGRALSLVPEEVRGLVDLMTAQYIPVYRVRDASYEPERAITRAQMELLAGRVSALNECFY